MSENKLVIGDLEFIRTPEKLLVYLIKKGRAYYYERIYSPIFKWF